MTKFFAIATLYSSCTLFLRLSPENAFLEVGSLNLSILSPIIPQAHAPQSSHSSQLAYQHGEGHCQIGSLIVLHVAPTSRWVGQTGPQLLLTGLARFHS